MHKKLNDFHLKITKFKDVNPRTKDNENLEVKVLDNARDLFNDLYYIYKERQEEEKDTFNKKETKKFDYTKLRLADDYLYDSEKKIIKLIKNLIKKNHL